MKVKSLKIRNFKGVENLEIKAHDKINVIVGVNGAGKSTVLQALNHLFSWYTARMKSVNGKGIGIGAQDINIHAGETLLEIELNNNVHWSIYKQKPSNRQKPIAKTDLSSMTHYVNELVETFEASPKDTSLPLIASYSVNRSVIDIPIRIRLKHELNPMSIYDIQLMNGANFRSFFAWFREREDIENEKMRYEKDIELDKQLQAVRNAISNVLPGYGELRIQRSPRAIVLNKNGNIFKIDQLSDGEKCYLTLIADIARRLAMANPGLENPLSGEGIIMIDEVDLHLHPSWQLEVVPKLRNTFPNCQFFLTTHSPHIVSDIRNNVRLE
ncbi:AAA family ATPase [Bacteroides sp. 224]|uniref:AAA family ATPase n=1 Tax=Bacteroides sp. 224 TaxID=2302936 RepID=UPI0013D78AB5|nr:AAA family ATPase [Bacteroides sp. 224]NDV63735.1 chromosome segregation protein SMC [Bacteroides sp. 224]